MFWSIFVVQVFIALLVINCSVVQLHCLVFWCPGRPLCWVLLATKDSMDLVSKSTLQKLQLLLLQPTLLWKMRTLRINSAQAECVWTWLIGSWLTEHDLIMMHLLLLVFFLSVFFLYCFGLELTGSNRWSIGFIVFYWIYWINWFLG